MELKPTIKILLVDDREDNLFSIETVLSKDGYEIKKARSGKEALKILLKEHDFTLILMDVQMPDINGIETASMIYERDKLKHIPIIFITANDYSEDFVFKGYRTGGVDYIYKPINPNLLRAKVGVFVELYKKNHLLMAHEQKLQEINYELEQRVKERTEELLKKNIDLEAMNLQLKRVNNDLDSFVYSASHDLKAPVSNIEGLLNTLIDALPKEIYSDETVHEILDMIGESILKFKSTISDLADITKIQRDVEDQMEEVDLKETIENVQINMRDLIVSSNAKITVDVEDCPKIKFSRKNLTSVFYNLLSNAIKYRSPDRELEVSVKAVIFGDYILVKIQDNGLGINSTDKDKIFNMFKRLHNHVEGSGVGLYIVKRIIENSGGKIEVESQQDKGSVFKVFFKASESSEIPVPKIMAV